MAMFKRYLIVKANGDCRVVQRKPHLEYNEVMFALNITVPRAWAEQIGAIDVSIPEGEVTVQVEQWLAEQRQGTIKRDLS